MNHTVKHIKYLVLVGLIGLSSSHYALAQDAKVGGIAINGAYTRATVPGQAAAGGFMKIDNSGAADQLISASSPAAAEVQLHTMNMDGNVMQMREVKQIDVPANAAVELKPGGLHLMFMSIKSPLKPGDTVSVKLKFAKAGELEVKMPVKAMGSNHHGAKH